MRESIILYDSWGRLVCGLPDDQAAKLCKMVFEYSFIGTMPESDDTTVNAMFSMIREKLDEDADKWNETRRARSEAGKKGNEVRWGNRKASQSDNLRSQNIANIAVSDSVSVYVSKDIKEKDKKESRRFTPPSLQEVSDYITEKGYHVDPNAFIDFYTSKGWKIGSQAMKDWKAAIRTWERREKTTPGNKFNNFEQNTYDFDALERQMISN